MTFYLGFCLDKGYLIGISSFCYYPIMSREAACMPIADEVSPMNVNEFINLFLTTGANNSKDTNNTALGNSTTTRP